MLAKKRTVYAKFEYNLTKFGSLPFEHTEQIYTMIEDLPYW